MQIALVLTLVAAATSAPTESPPPLPEEPAAGTSQATQCQPEPASALPSPESLGDAIVAAVDDSYYTTAEYIWDLQNSPPTRRREILSSHPLANALVNGWIEDEVLYRQALEEGYETDPQVLKLLEQAKRAIILRVYREKGFDFPAEVGDEEAREYFLAHPEEFSRPPSVRIRHILVSSEEEARALLEELSQDPSRFESVARERSLDTGSKFLGGDLGELTREELNLRFGQDAERELFAAELDSVHGPYRTEEGWHLVKVVGRKEAITVDEERGVALAKRKLAAQRYQRAYNEALSRMKQEHTIYINEEALRKIGEGKFPGVPPLPTTQ